MFLIYIAYSSVPQQLTLTELKTEDTKRLYDE
jgi:hypothetical protein